MKEFLEASYLGRFQLTEKTIDAAFSGKNSRTGVERNKWAAERNGSAARRILFKDRRREGATATRRKVSG